MDIGYAIRTKSVHKKWCVWCSAKTKGKHIIGTKWIFRNKLNEQGEVVRKKARMVAQGYNQYEGIDDSETFSPFSRL